MILVMDYDEEGAFCSDNSEKRFFLSYEFIMHKVTQFVLFQYGSSRKYNFSDIKHKIVNDLSLKVESDKDMENIKSFADEFDNVVAIDEEHLTVEYNMSSGNYNSVYVKDKFGDLGLVGAIIINDDTVDLFCLSCRALGREVENRMVRFILDEYDTKYIKFFNTYKNNEIKQYLCGYFDILKIKN